MQQDLTQYVTYELGSQELAADLPRIQEAIEWLASKPEGAVLFKKMYELHGKPVKIYIGTQPMAAYYPDYHTIGISPRLMDNLTYFTETGAAEKYTYEQFFAHELTHACQTFDVELVKKFMTAANQALMQQTNLFLERLPKEEIKAKFRNCGGDLEKIRPFMEAFYDKYLAPHSHQLYRDIEKAVSQEPAVKEYSERYEKDAIAMDNLMACHLNKPERHLDYATSIDLSTMRQLSERDTFVEFMMELAEKAHAKAANIKELMNNTLYSKPPFAVPQNQVFDISRYKNPAQELSIIRS